jgi:hypothetical protein
LHEYFKPFAHHELIRLAQYTCLKNATTGKISLILIIYYSIFVSTFQQAWYIKVYGMLQAALHIPWHTSQWMPSAENSLDCCSNHLTALMSVQSKSVGLEHSLEGIKHIVVTFTYAGSGSMGMVQ